MKEFEWVEHPADLGVRLYGASLEELFENGIKALFASLESTVDSRIEKFNLNIKAENPEELLVWFLEELLYRVATKRLATFQGKVRIQRLKKGVRLTSKLEARKIIRLGREIKAVTYHKLNIEKKAGRYHCTVIFDL